MASLFTPQHSEIYTLVLENDKTIAIKFTWDNELKPDEECNFHDCYECYNVDTSERYVIYTRDHCYTTKTFTTITLMVEETERKYLVERMYFNDVLIYKDSRLIPFP